MPNTASVNIYRWLGRANASNKQRTKPGVDTAGRINLVITHISEKVIASAFCEAISRLMGKSDLVGIAALASVSIRWENTTYSTGGSIAMTTVGSLPLILSHVKPAGRFCPKAVRQSPSGNLYNAEVSKCDPIPKKKWQATSWQPEVSAS